MTDGVFPVGDADYDRVYAQEAAMVDASELVAHTLEASGMSKAELARALGVSRSEVTGRLAGERNITVRKLADTLHACGWRLVLNACPRTVTESLFSEPVRFAFEEPAAATFAQPAVSGAGWKEVRRSHYGLAH